jgi:hypothetical protein
VLYAPLIPKRDEVAAILRSGKNGVTPVGWFYPTEKDGAPLAAACADGRTTLHGTGIKEFSDIRTYRAPDVVRHIMMFGGKPDEAMGGPMLGLLSGGFVQSARMCLDTLGFSPDAEIRRSQEVAVATASIETPIGVIEPGLVAGQRFVWEALDGDTCVVRIAVNWLMGEEHLDPAWDFGPGSERFEIEVGATPTRSSPSRAGSPRPSRRAWSAIPASSRPPCTA